MPADWLNLTTHRLDIYNEDQAKAQFLEQLEVCYRDNNAERDTLEELPTAYDYIRLGHPLSCLLEWSIANLNNTTPENIITFSSTTIPIFAILRTNLIKDQNTRLLYKGEMPKAFDAEALRAVYGYQFELQEVDDLNALSPFDGSTVYISEQNGFSHFDFASHIDFVVQIHAPLGSVVAIGSEQDKSYVSEIQHVRRRETIAMTPANCLTALHAIAEGSSLEAKTTDREASRSLVCNTIQSINDSDTKVLVASSGLSIQYAISMGLIHDAFERYPEKTIKFIVPTNCYGGTNDQARRIAACSSRIEVVDLAVDGDSDMVQSINTALESAAQEDAVPLIIAEIPTNPRVEVPDLLELKNVLSASRKTSTGEPAIEPVFILDQTFCPNVHFVSEDAILSPTKTISYVSGSKFPSGGKCTAGYCIGNKNADSMMEKIELHLKLCDNEATDHQLALLAQHMPSMLQRIDDAYKNTREFVTFISETLPGAKINFVSETLSEKGFTPSVFSLDLPTKGNTEEEKEAYKRELNLKLINMMISEIPHESKFCVSYGQLKGCYWTIPATSTQGTTKEGDKDYIVRVSVSPQLDLERHKKVFATFVKEL